MHARWLALVALVPLSGCLDYAGVTLQIDLKAGTAVMIVEGLGTTDRTEELEDFADLVNEQVLGDAIQKDHPEWTVGERSLYVTDGRLDGKVAFTFDDPQSLGLYKHDRKSPWFWCADSGDHITSTNGTIIPNHPDCVVFERKAKVLEVSTRTGHQPESLMEAFLAWDGETFDE